MHVTLLHVQKVSRAALLFGLVTLASPSLAWTGPTTAPPGGNVSAPLNTSATAQTKSGEIIINSPSGFYGLSATSIGAPAIFGHSNNSYGLYAISDSSWGGVIVGPVGSGLVVENSAGSIYSELMAGGYGLITNQPVYTTDLYMTSIGNWLSTALTSSNSGHKFGGGFQLTSGGGCYVGNALTGGGCSCPGYAPNASWTYYMDTNSTYGGGRGYVCYGS